MKAFVIGVLVFNAVFFFAAMGISLANDEKTRISFVLFLFGLLQIAAILAVTS